MDVAKDVERYPIARRGVGKWGAVIKPELRQARQALQQQRKIHFQLGHGPLCLQGFEALPGYTQPIKPEQSTGQTRFKLKQKIGVKTLGETALVAFEFVVRKPTQSGYPLTVGVGIIGDRKPGQCAAQAQGTQISGTLAQPPGAQWPSLLLQCPQQFLRVFFVVDRLFRPQQLRRHLLDLSDGTRNTTRLGTALQGKRQTL